MPPEDDAIAVTDLRATYPARRGRRGGGSTGPRVALDDVTFRLPAGASLALLGPNGSGKTTLMRILCGLSAPDSGTVRVLGSERPSEYRRGLGVVFQSPALDPHLTVRENLVDQARLFGLAGTEARRRVDDGLAAVDLTDRHHDLVRTLSGGMKRRVDLCRALLHRPGLLLLDEPTAGLDPVSRAQFLEHLDGLRSAGMAVLMSTHLVDEAERLDRALLLDHGRVVADDTPAHLRAGLGDRRVTVLDPDFEPDGDGWRRTAGRWSRSVVPEELGSLAESLARRGAPFTFAPPDLGDVFASLTGRALEPEGAHTTEAASADEGATA